MRWLLEPDTLLSRYLQWNVINLQNVAVCYVPFTRRLQSELTRAVSVVLQCLRMVDRVWIPINTF